MVAADKPRKSSVRRPRSRCLALNRHRIDSIDSIIVCDSNGEALGPAPRRTLPPSPSRVPFVAGRLDERRIYMPPTRNRCWAFGRQVDVKETSWADSKEFSLGLRGTVRILPFTEGIHDASILPKIRTPISVGSFAISGGQVVDACHPRSPTPTAVRQGRGRDRGRPLTKARYDKIGMHPGRQAGNLRLRATGGDARRSAEGAREAPVDPTASSSPGKFVPTGGIQATRGSDRRPSLSTGRHGRLPGLFQGLRRRPGNAAQRCDGSVPTQ
jgi:hypothetical protein